MRFDRAPSIGSGKSAQTRRLSSETSQYSQSPGADSPQIPSIGLEDSPSKQKGLKRFNTMKLSTNFLADLKQGIEQESSMEQKEKPQDLVQNNPAKLLTVSNLLKKYQHYADSPMRKLGEPQTFKPTFDGKISRVTSESINSPSVQAVKVNFNSDAPEIDSDISIDSKHSNHSNLSAPAPAISNFYEASNTNDSNIQYTDLSSGERSANNSVVNSPSRIANFLPSPCGKSSFFKPRVHDTGNRINTDKGNDSEEDGDEEEDNNNDQSETKEEDSFVQRPVIKHSRNMSDSNMESKLNFGGSPLDPRSLVRKGFSPAVHSVGGLFNKTKSPVTPLTEKLTMNQIAKQMAKVKMEIDKKKTIMGLYDYVFSKAKQMANQEPSLHCIFFFLIILLNYLVYENIKEDIEEELENVRNKVKDLEAEEFVKNVLKTLEVFFYVNLCI